MAGDAFVIMHIGDDDLDRVYEDVIAPALQTCGLKARRIDLDNEGGLLNAEIMASIERSDILVADLTNERPNCYLEVGYALGLGRSRNLVLTVRRDHLPGQPNHDPAGPRVHFDLAGYDLLLWDEDDLDAFRDGLVQRVSRRLFVLEGSLPSETGATVSPWYADQRDAAIAEIQSLIGPGFMEASFELVPPKVERKQSELLEAARAAEIHTFGYPIGLVLDVDEHRPRPTGSSIRARVHGKRFIGGDESFDFWELRTDGDYYMVQSLFEDQLGHTDRIFFNTRLVRVTEALLYCARLYDRLGVPADREVRVTIRHGGLAGRTLASATRTRLVHPRTCAAGESTSTVTFRLGEIDARLVGLVIDIAAPLFELFDFFELGREVYDEIIDAFVQGRVV